MIKLKCIKALGGGLTVGKEYLVEHLHFIDDDGSQRGYSKTMLPDCFEIILEEEAKPTEIVKREGVVALLPEGCEFTIGQEVMVVDSVLYYGKAVLIGCEYDRAGCLDGYLVETKEKHGSPNDGGLCKDGHALWVINTGIEAIAEEQPKVEPKKPKKWGDWIKNKTGECPVGLKRKQKVKLKWSDGDEFVIDNPQDAAWYFSSGNNPVDITHYKMKLKDAEYSLPPKSKWTKNTGAMPVDPDVKVEFKRRYGDRGTLLSGHCDWTLNDEVWDIIKWRLAK